jgi:UPF0271 protein
MRTIDLNCDMGEGFGPWRMGNDAELMNYVTSVNIACGFHAGDPTIMRKTVALAAEKGVAIGAHPSFPDLQGFGRRNMSLHPSEIFDLVLYQVGALKAICESAGTNLRHVKPHGALYNQAARSEEIAGAIAETVRSIDKDLILYGLSGSSLISEAEKVGLKAASEVFADRTYQPDGSLTPRSQPDALITESGVAIWQAIQMVRNGTVTSTNGDLVPLIAETICVHGDGPNAVDFAASLREAFRDNGIEVRAISK